MRNMHGSRPVRATAALVMSTALMTGLGTVSNAAPAPLNQLRKLAREAERTSEKIHHANDDLQKAKRDEAAAKKAIAKASKDAAIAEHKREGMQEPLNKIASINLRNGQTAGVVRVLMADSPQEILDQSRSEAAMTQTTLNILVDYEKVVNSAHQAQRTAAENREKAVKAQAQARKAQRDLNKERITMRKRIAAVRSEFASLPPSQRDSWKRVKLPAGFDPKIAFGNNILGNKALQIAMTRIGSPYVWGATGPNAFDCSGLVYWAYRQLGVTLPRSSQGMAVGGLAVPAKDIQPGDLVVYYSDASHVGLYAGNGQVLHAPTFGQTVQLAPLHHAPIKTIRRY